MRIEDVKIRVYVANDGTEIEYCDLLEGLENFIKKFWKPLDKQLKMWYNKYVR